MGCALEQQQARAGGGGRGGGGGGSGTRRVGRTRDRTGTASKRLLAPQQAHLRIKQGKKVSLRRICSAHILDLGIRNEVATMSSPVIP
eukprot:766237-Hanusia_phi.AAC.2